MGRYVRANSGGGRMDMSVHEVGGRRRMCTTRTKEGVVEWGPDGIAHEVGGCLEGVRVRMSYRRVRRLNFCDGVPLQAA
eukprot:756136-Hanusia_phi.AAC.1